MKMQQAMFGQAQQGADPTQMGMVPEMDTGSGTSSGQPPAMGGDTGQPPMGGQPPGQQPTPAMA